MPELQPYNSMNRLMDDMPSEVPLSMQQSQKIGQMIKLGTGGGPNKARTGIMVALIAVLWGCGFAFMVGFSVVADIFDLPSELAFIGDLGGAAACVIMPLLFFGTVIVAVGFTFVWNKMIGQKLGTPSVHASEVRVRSGDNLDIDFIQSVKGAVEVQGIDFRFYLQEEVTYTSGTDTVTVRKDFTIAEESRPGRTMQSGHNINERFRFDLPADAMHTFFHSNNKIQWFVKVNVKIARWPDFNGIYEIIVLPERGGGA